MKDQRFNLISSSLQSQRAQKGLTQNPREVSKNSVLLSEARPSLESNDRELIERVLGEANEGKSLRRSDRGRGQPRGKNELELEMFPSLRLGPSLTQTSFRCNPLGS